MGKTSWVRLSLAVVAACYASAMSAPSARAANIIVEYTGTDQVGTELAYELRERIAASSQHTLVHTREDAGFRVILVTVGSNDRASSAYSAVLVWKNFVDPEGLDFFITTFAGNCGRTVAARCAASVLSGMDVEISRIVSAVLGAAKK